MLIIPENIQAPASITVQFIAPYLAVDLTTVSEVRLNVTRRDGTVDVWTMAIDSSTPGALLAHYTFQTGDISGIGLYYLAPVLDVPGGNVPADTLSLFVTTNTRLSPRLETDAWVVATSAVETLGPVKREWVLVDDTDSPYPALLTSPYIAPDLTNGNVVIVLPEGNDGDAFIISDYKNGNIANDLIVAASGSQLVPDLNGAYASSFNYGGTAGLVLRLKLAGDFWIPW